MQYYFCELEWNSVTTEIKTTSRNDYSGRFIFYHLQNIYKIIGLIVSSKQRSIKGTTIPSETVYITIDTQRHI